MIILCGCFVKAVREQAWKKGRKATKMQASKYLMFIIYDFNEKKAFRVIK